MVPRFQMGEIWFNSDIAHTSDFAELITELESVTYTAITAAADDGLDCLSQLSRMTIVYPTHLDIKWTPENSDSPIYQEEIEEVDNEGLNSYLVD